MIEKINSKLDGKVLHIVFRPNGPMGIGLERIELIGPENYLQAAYIKIPSEFEFRAHSHLTRARSFEKLIAQESWVVIRGQVEVTYFDLDDSIINSYVLEAGESTITLRGGHSYRTLDDYALVYEFKSGPYEGVDIDKRFIK